VEQGSRRKLDVVKSIHALILVSILAASPLFATEPNPSKEQRAQIDKLFAAMNLDTMMRDSMNAMFEQVEKQYLSGAGDDEEALAEAKERFAFFREHAAKIDFGGEFREACTRLYAKYFTAQELSDLTAFYTSDTGRKSIKVMPEMMQEAMQVGTQHLGAQIEEAMRMAQEDSDKKRPWRRTMRDMSAIGSALQSYAEENDGKYPEGDFASLEETLDYDEFPKSDVWKHDYAYVVSDDRLHYRIVSAGADSIFEWDSRRIPEASESAPPVRYANRLEDDVIYADGMFVQMPLQAKPKD
jgi:hypothetical protein